MTIEKSLQRKKIFQVFLFATLSLVVGYIGIQIFYELLKIKNPINTTVFLFILLTDVIIGFITYFSLLAFRTFDKKIITKIELGIKNRFSVTTERSKE